MINYCQNCGEEFQVVRYKQIFCSRRCFKNNYIQKQKENTPPKYICPGCGAKITLIFNPKKEKERWKNWQCPVCKAERGEVVKPEEELIN